MKERATPPSYRVRTSVRAKRVSLRVLPGKGLEVVLPLHADPACVPDILSRYSGWIARTLKRMPQAVPAPDNEAAVPDTVLIKGGKETLRLRPEERKAPRERVREEARLWLGEMLDRLAAGHGFRYTDLSIRFQRTRWGSCSAKGGISLNACLLFLPEPQVRYILLHELCHTRELNHSARYWKILFSLEPDALALDKSMSRAWRFIPMWLFPQEG